MNMINHNAHRNPAHVPLLLGRRDLDLIRYALHSAPEVTQREAQRIIGTLDHAEGVLASVRAGALHLRPIGSLGGAG